MCETSPWDTGEPSPVCVDTIDRDGPMIWFGRRQLGMLCPETEGALEYIWEFLGAWQLFVFSGNKAIKHTKEVREQMCFYRDATIPLPVRESKMNSYCKTWSGYRKTHSMLKGGTFPCGANSLNLIAHHQQKAGGIKRMKNLLVLVQMLHRLLWKGQIAARTCICFTNVQGDVRGNSSVLVRVT